MTRAEVREALWEIFGALDAIAADANNMAAEKVPDEPDGPLLMSVDDLVAILERVRGLEETWSAFSEDVRRDT